MNKKYFCSACIIFVVMFNFAQATTVDNFSNVTEKVKNIILVEKGTIIECTKQEAKLSVNNSQIAIVEGQKIKITDSGRFKVTVSIAGQTNKISYDFFSWNAYLKSGKFYTYNDSGRTDEASVLYSSTYLDVSEVNKNVFKVEDYVFNTGKYNGELKGKYLTSYYDKSKDESTSKYYEYAMKSDFKAPQMPTISEEVSLTVMPENKTITGLVGEKVEISVTPQKNFTVKFDANGGTVDTTSTQLKGIFDIWEVQDKSGKKLNQISGQKSNDGLIKLQYKLEKGEQKIVAKYKFNKITLPTPIRDGYEFTGWYTGKKESDYKLGMGGTQYKFTDPRNVTLYAQWKKVEQAKLIVMPENKTITGVVGEKVEISAVAQKNFTVKFDANGGKVDTTSTQLKGTFDIWEVQDKSGKKLNQISGQKSNDGLIKLQYKLEKGEQKIVAKYKFNKITLPMPIREGYEFTGWYTGKKENDYKLGMGGIEYKFTDPRNVTLYAQWEKLGASNIVEGTTTSNKFQNPLRDKNGKIVTGADPWIIYKDGYYYFTCTKDMNIQISKSENLQDIGQSYKKVFTSPNNSAIWAPELHYINDRWYIYYTDIDGEDEGYHNGNRRIFVLRAKTSDPLGEYELMGKVYDLNNDYFAIDGTVLQWNNELYLLWSGWKSKTWYDGMYHRIYIAKLNKEKPWIIEGERVEIVKPQKAWETYGGHNVTEAPQVLIKDGTLHIIYSACGAGTDNYCLGMITYNGGDILKASSWEKTSEAVFKSANGVYSPGHCSFTKSPDGKEDWIVYHAANQKGDSATWKRNIRIQKFTWNGTTPIFGKPVVTDSYSDLPSQ